MMKQFLGAVLCSALVSPVLAQKTPLSFGFSLANASMAHPFENPPQPGSSSNVNGGYGNISEKDYNVQHYTVEGIISCAVTKSASLRLRGGYSFRQTAFTSVYAGPDQVNVINNNQELTSRSWHLAPGFISTHSKGKFSVDLGVEIPYYSLARLESYSSSEYPSMPEIETSEYWRYFPGGYSMGIGPLAGFSFHPVKCVGIGIEVRSAWMYTHIKGNYEEKTNWSGTIATSSGTAENYRNSGMSNTQIALQLRFAL